MCIEYGVEKPTIEVSESWVTAIFKRPLDKTEVNVDAIPSVTGQVTEQVRKLIKYVDGEKSRAELQEALGLKHRDNFMESYLQPSQKVGFIEYTIPAKPKSRLHKYRLTEKGKIYLANMKSSS